MKKRILFVERDPVLLAIYTRVLDDDLDRWEVSTASDAREALDLMDLCPFDIMVSELRVPGSSGTGFLTDVKKRHPRVSRIILSEITDQEEVARCLNSIHQFLPKPFEVNGLKIILARMSGLDSYLQDEKLRVLVSQLGTLPSLPSLYVEIMRELSSDDPSVETVAGIIARDPGMTARILQIVNSAVLGLARKISSPFEAVQYLGFGTVRSLVLSAHIFSCFQRTNLKGFSIDQLWKHAMGTGTLARLIMRLQDANPTDTEEAYIGGMLHDIGKLMLADSRPRQYEQALQLAAERKVPVHETELEVFGASHAAVAAYLLGLWGLPVAIVEAVAFHHTPSRSALRAFGPLSAVHAANIMEYELSQTRPAGRIADFDMAYLASVGADTRLEAWRLEALKLYYAPREE
jgi:HD-like signal output (HDOD) protein